MLRSRPSRNPSTPQAKAPPPSTARSSTSPGGTSMRAFDLAKSLAGAKNLTDMVELQTAFWRKQFGALTAQAEEVRELSTKVTADAAQAIKAHMTRGVNGPKGH
jgi:phasin family protein